MFSPNLVEANKVVLEAFHPSFVAVLHSNHSKIGLKQHGDGPSKEGGFSKSHADILKPSLMMFGPNLVFLISPL